MAEWEAAIVSALNNLVMVWVIVAIVKEKSVENTKGFNGIQTRDLCDTSAALLSV